MTELPLWQPSAGRIESARLTAFRRLAEARAARSLRTYAELHRFSVEQPSLFWPLVWDVADILAEHRGDTVVSDARMPGARFFPDARLNFAENLLRAADDRPAILFWGEGRSRRALTRRELTAAVARCAAGLRDLGLRPGDRVAGYLPNLPETVVAALAAASLGAVWSSCSPDFGVQGVLERFGQIAPRVIIAADGYYYGDEHYASLERLEAIVRGLPSVEAAVVVPYTNATPDMSAVSHAVTWDDLLARGAPSPGFEQFPFDHPLYILYSSGTTGPPKCIVHGAGGTLLQHVKEHQLHCDVRKDDRVFYFTTCGWMMWNWLISALASEAVLVLYDGSPFHAGGRILFDLADATGTTLFGTSAKFLVAVEKAGLRPIETHALASVRTITSTGSPLAPASFEFVYAHVKKDVHLASISGGTDIVGCFVGGDPTGPVWPGEIQVRCLGMDVDVVDDSGRPVREQQGELVCRRPFPSMPVGFWNDPDGRRYQDAYFTRFPGVWCHGDWAEITRHDGLVISGRSDAVLNPGGVRIGTAELYRQVEGIDEVAEAIAVGQRWQGDERVVLFVRLREGATLDEALTARIRARIRQNTSPRHVPARILQVRDIPRTRSGKIVELAVRDVIHGRDVKNREALANPDALEEFRARPELDT
jgi:acetoacetyl-CoA synthetase